MERLTNAQRVLKELRTKLHLTTIDLVTRAKVADPHKEIANLRKKGYLIHDTWYKHNGKRFKVWQLIAEPNERTEDNRSNNN